MHRPWLPLLVSAVGRAAAGLRHARTAGVLRSRRRRSTPTSCRAICNEGLKETGVPNIVTAVLASYRGYDTLGETTVVFTAGAGVVALLRRRRATQGALRSEARPDPAGRREAAHPVHAAVRAVRAVSRRLRSRRRLPGGRDHRRRGRSSTRSSSGWPTAQAVVPEPLVESMMAAGVLIYAGVGVGGPAARRQLPRLLRARPRPGARPAPRHLLGRGRRGGHRVRRDAEDLLHVRRPRQDRTSEPRRR